MNKFKTPQFVLVMFYSAALFAVIGYVITQGLPEIVKEEPVKTIITMLISFLVAKTASLVHFYAESSEGSKDKSETLKEVQNNNG